MLKGAAMAVDSSAISSRAPTHFILLPVMLTATAVPAVQDSTLCQNCDHTSSCKLKKCSSSSPHTSFVMLILPMASVGDDVKKILLVTH